MRTAVSAWIKPAGATLAGFRLLVWSPVFHAWSVTGKTESTTAVSIPPNGAIYYPTVIQ